MGSNASFSLAVARDRASAGKIELVFSRITSICQAISRVVEFLQRARAPAPNRRQLCVRTDAPSASPISPPSLGATKCGTFNVRSAARSARCSGHSGSESLSHSESRAMKSACADQTAPSSMVR